MMKKLIFVLMVSFCFMVVAEEPEQQNIYNKLNAVEALNSSTPSPTVNEVTPAAQVNDEVPLNSARPVASTQSLN